MIVNYRKRLGMIKELKILEKDILTCTQCALHKTRINAVVGSGNLNANILFVGEAPGANEDKEGKPFVGRSGKILDKLLASIDLKREDVYITNIVKCRPPENRNPSSQEINICSLYLDKQVQQIQPKIIVTLGRFASEYVSSFTSSDFSNITKDAGKIFKTANIFYPDFIPLLHPAVACYNPNKFDVLLEHFKILKEFV